MSRVVHFEIPATDGEKVRSFYSNTFGWEFNKWGEVDYWLIHTGDEKKPGIDGGQTTVKIGGQQVVNTISIENIDEVIEKVKANGGSIVREKSAVPGIGWLFYFKDPEGTVWGAMLSDQTAK